MRLATGDPAPLYEQCVDALAKLLHGGCEILASNQVVGEAYVALQHHYGVSKDEARSALISVFKSGIVAPLNGPAVLTDLAARSGCGLVDRLIAGDYGRWGLPVVTLDRRMATLPGARRL